MVKEKNSAIDNDSIETVAKDTAKTVSGVQPVPFVSTNKATLNSDADTSNKETQPSSFIVNLYQQINSVLGGSDTNQFLYLTIPGQALSPENFTYDYKNTAPKGPVVQANESRLADKLFDSCRMTGSDNGLTLPYQYRTALDMLTPKLNSKIAVAKNQLRDLLMTEYPYDFGDGDDKKFTLQEAFFRLYDEWVDASEKWSETQNRKKEELRKMHPGTDAKSNEKINDAYLEWYEMVAESNINAINEKLSKVISVFTPNDMKILEGIFDSGSCAELQQAGQTLTNTQKLSSDGGYVYPVTFNPTNWFDLLDTSFTPIDLLKNLDVLSAQLQSLSSRRMKLNERIADISEQIPDKTAIKEARKKFSDAKSALDTVQSGLITIYGNGIKSLLDTVFDIAPLFEEGAIPANIIAKLASDVGTLDENDVSGLINDINKVTAKSFNAQQELVNASQTLADASAKAVETQNLANLKSLLSPLNEQLDEINAQITELQNQIQLAAVTQPAPDTSTGKVTDNDVTKAAVTSASVPEGYTKIEITADASTLDKSTHSLFGSSTFGASFRFCDSRWENSSSYSLLYRFLNITDTSIKIGLNIAKVGFEREWFDPTVFDLTKDIAAGDSVFPCYPAAMVIARDISIDLISKTSISSEFTEAIENYAASSGAYAVSADNTVTLKFVTPQIIGYYLDDTSGYSQADYVTIFKFVEAYKKMLKAINKNNN